MSKNRNPKYSSRKNNHDYNPEKILAIIDAAEVRNMFCDEDKVVKVPKKCLQLAKQILALKGLSSEYKIKTY